MTIDEIRLQLADGATLEGPHWTEPVKVLAVKARGARVEVQAVGLHTKRLWNKLLKAEDFDGAIKIIQAGELAALTGNPTHFRLAAEAHRIRLAFQYDPHFAVSVSQVDPLPHQMDAVYSHLLTQPQMRFLIADDPGAGKTIMAGLTLKELKFRGLVERTLIVTPANLTDQWRRELQDKFGETFAVVNRGTVGAAYGRNVWEDNAQCITSIDFVARQDDILNLLRDVRWDLCVVDEAHKMAAYRYGQKVNKTQRYEFGEFMRDRTDHYLFLTATPHKGDPDNFALLLQLLDKDLYVTGDILAEASANGENRIMIRRLKEDMKKFDGSPCFPPRNVKTLPYKLTPDELTLYEAVTDYVQHNFQRAEAAEKYGHSDSRPVPDYIKRLIAHDRAKKKPKGGSTLFEKQDGEAVAVEDDEILPTAEITEAEYRKNPLAADVKFWGGWVLENARKCIGKFYPPDPDGGVPVAYLWARTVKCPNPQCSATIPLVRHLMLCRKKGRDVALRLIPDKRNKECRFEIAEGKEIDYDPEEGTMQRGQAACPLCDSVAGSKYLQKQGHSGEIHEQLMAVVTVTPGRTGKRYRAGEKKDARIFREAADALGEAKQHFGATIVPEEPLKPWSGVFNAPLFGLTTWAKLFNDRQALALSTFIGFVKQAISLVQKEHDQDYVRAVGTYLGVAASRFSDFGSSLCTFNYTGGRGVKNTFGRQALPMVWDYAESAPFNPQGANWQASVEAASETILRIAPGAPAVVIRGTATGLAVDDEKGA